MPRRIGRAAIIVALGVATLTYGALEKHVIVQIEGVPVSVRTFAGTVNGALQRAGVDVGARDIVQPSPASAITDGSVIEIKRAKPVTLLLDGRPRRVIVTGLTIQEVLREIELDTRLVDEVSPPRTATVRPGMTITYERARSMVVRHGGKATRVITNADTVGQVIRELGIKLRPRDIVRPGLKRSPEQGMVVRVLKVRVRTETKRIRLSYDTILRHDDDLDHGERKVIQDGREGVKHVRYRTRLVNGKTVSRTILASRVLREPVDRIIAVGSGPRCPCKTGVETGGASWYSQADGMTAAHKTLPFGTLVRVENLENGRVVTVRIADRGPYIDGRVIDLSDEAFARIAPLSQGVARVRISW